ncbi:3-deoxy-D-manno-octulosonic acid transferase [Rhodovastum atsumiense]|uniref:3-deoxy-D-manno-octulosonic acid transferase n=2 Tax=Rhodovastum atsumiense TaxID=504468 RepID=A0A5M6IY96_9PROT|nr:3-deoxy-D-manno-octulosonic acid transferase [Rhodovastum atsumiense]
MLSRRVARGKEIAPRLPERRGIDAAPRPPGRLIWLHAASVGETISVLPLLQALATAPGTVLMTTGTVTSAALLARRLPELGLEGRVLHRFVPLDVPAWVARFLDHWRPDAAGFVESEIWPNLIIACRRRGIPLMLVNARLSARSFAQWQRLPCLARTLFGAFDRAQAQSEADAARLRRLGARHVSAPGNLKFAAPPLPADTTELARLRARVGDRPVWLAASTYQGEDTLVRRVHETLLPAHPGLLTILVPRHPERGAEIATLLAGLPVSRRALGEDPPEQAGIWIGDTLGELGLQYRLAPIVFVGRSLVPEGGQNPLEAARLGGAVAIGPHAFNFVEPVAVLRAAGALTEVADADALAAWVDALLRDPGRRAAMGRAGTEAASRHAGLPDEVTAMLLGLLHAR